jgi:hypothetical protein
MQENPLYNWDITQLIYTRWTALLKVIYIYIYT